MAKPEPADDKTYAQASGKTMGRFFAEAMMGMIEGGMTRQEALLATVEYMKAMASIPPYHPPETKEDA